MRGRTRVSENYLGYSFFKFLAAACCCCSETFERRVGCCQRRMRQIRKFDLARERFNDELDVVNLLKFKREGHLMIHLMLRRYQRNFVRFFRRYTVFDSEIEDGASGVKVDRQMKIESMLSRLQVDADSTVDERIQFEITGEIA